jgi:hypothetical protein
MMDKLLLKTDSSNDMREMMCRINARQIYRISDRKEGEGEQ